LQKTIYCALFETSDSKQLDIVGEPIYSDVFSNSRLLSNIQDAKCTSLCTSMPKRLLSPRWET